MAGFGLVRVGQSRIEQRALSVMDGVEGHLRRRSIKAVINSVEGHQYTGGLCLQRRSVGDTCHAPIGEARKYL
jgi:hypothetical protein